MPRKPDPRCDGCRHWRRLYGGRDRKKPTAAGRCYRFPPTAMLGPNFNEISRHPITAEDDGCAEHRAFESEADGAAD